MAKETTGARLRAVHRIELGEGNVIEPGAEFRMRDPKEADRLLRLGAATVVEEEAAAAAVWPGEEYNK